MSYLSCYWKKLAIALVTACGGCANTGTATLEDLPLIEREAYVVLMDQLHQLKLDKNLPQLVVCTKIKIEDKPLPANATLLEALDRAAPAEVNMQFVDGATCHQNDFSATLTSAGTRALNLSASRYQDPKTKEVAWLTEATWEAMWGGGRVYKVVIKDGIPVAEVEGWWGM